MMKSESEPVSSLRQLRVNRWVNNEWGVVGVIRETHLNPALTNASPRINDLSCAT